MDDVINVSGHRIGTAEVESALVLNHKCAEAAVVGFEHPIKGQGIYAFVTLMDGVEFNEDVQKELVKCVPHLNVHACRPSVACWQWCPTAVRSAGKLELRSDLSQPLMSSTGHLACRRREAARSCAAF